MTVVDLHPPISAPAFREADVEGGLLANVGAIIKMARENDTPECRFLSRQYGIEYRALADQALEHKDRELLAFRSAWMELHRQLGVAPLAS